MKSMNTLEHVPGRTIQVAYKGFAAPKKARATPPSAGPTDTAQVASPAPPSASAADPASVNPGTTNPTAPIATATDVPSASAADPTTINPRKTKNTTLSASAVAGGVDALNSLAVSSSKLAPGTLPVAMFRSHVADLTSPSPRPTKAGRVIESVTALGTTRSVEAPPARTLNMESLVASPRAYNYKRVRSPSTNNEQGIPTEDVLAAYFFEMVLVKDVKGKKGIKIPSGYSATHIPRCTACGMVAVGARDAYRMHAGRCKEAAAREHKLRMMASTEEANKTEAATEDHTEKIVRAFVNGGGSIVTLYQHAQELIGYDQSLTTFYKLVWGGLLEVSSSMLADLRSRLRQEPLVVAIDAGTSSVGNQHMLVLVAYYRGRGLMLPPSYQSTAFTAAGVDAAANAILGKIGLTADDVDIWIADGCRVNTAFFDLLDRELPEIEQIVTEPKDEPHKRPAQILEFGRARHFVYCRGHWINVILTQCKAALLAQYPLAMDALAKFNQSLFNADGRARRARDYVETFVVVERNETGGVASALEQLTRGLTRYTPESRVSRMADLGLEPIADETLQSMKERLLAAAEEAAKSAGLAARKRPSGLRKTGATRWMANRYQAIEYMVENFAALQAWVAYESFTRKPCESVTSLSNLMNGEQKDTLRQELEGLLAVMLPFANYLKCFSDETPYVSLIVTSEDNMLRVVLQEMLRKDKDNKFLQTASKLTKEYRADSRNDDLWEACQYFDPAYAASMANDADCWTADAIRKAFRISTKSHKLPDADWKAYLESVALIVQQLPLQGDLPRIARWWSQQGHLFNNVYALARIALNTPAVVTGCDAVFSADASLFTTRRLSLTVDNASRQLAVKYNLTKWKSIVAEDAKFGK